VYTLRNVQKELYLLECEQEYAQQLKTFQTCFSKLTSKSIFRTTFCKHRSPEFYPAKGFISISHYYYYFQQLQIQGIKTFVSPIIQSRSMGEESMPRNWETLLSSPESSPGWIMGCTRKRVTKTYPPKACVKSMF